MSGGGKASNELLRQFIERIERIDEQRAALGDDRKAVFAEAKASGFDTKIIRAVIKARKIDKADRDESKALFDTYMHAIGMDEPPPLFRHVGLMAVDRAARDSVVAALGELVPDLGEIILKPGGGSAVRLFRNADGKPQAEDWHEPEPKPEARRADATGRLSVAAGGKGEASLVEARKKGRKAGEARSAERNPFPKGDIRRAAWDEQYRRGLEALDAANSSDAADQSEEDGKGEDQ